MANFAFLLIADRFARARGERRGVALRAAWPAAFINPPALGLAVAVALANRNAPPPVPPPPPPPLPPPPQQAAAQLIAAYGRRLTGSVLPAPPQRHVGAAQQPFAGPGPQRGAAPNVSRVEPFVPSFVGYTAEQAREVAGFTNIVLIVEPDKDALEDAKGRVRRQVPPAGAPLPDDMTVRLTFG
jgi:hypothetical protein